MPYVEPLKFNAVLDVSAVIVDLESRVLSVIEYEALVKVPVALELTMNIIFVEDTAVYCDNKAVPKLIPEPLTVIVLSFVVSIPTKVAVGTKYLVRLPVEIVLGTSPDANDCDDILSPLDAEVAEVAVVAASGKIV